MKKIRFEESEVKKKFPTLEDLMFRNKSAISIKKKKDHFKTKRKNKENEQDNELW